MVTKYNKIDFTSKAFAKKWFKKREKDTLPVERILNPSELRNLHNSIHFTKKMFPHVLAANIRNGLPNEKDKKLI